MNKYTKLLLIACALNACQSSTNFNTVDLTKFTGEKFEESSQFESLVIPGLVAAGVIFALSLAGNQNSSSSVEPNEMDSEWIE